MTPETRTSLTTAAFATVPVVIVAVLAIAYVGRGPGGQGSRVNPASCDDLKPDTYWGVEFESSSGTPTTRPYMLATVDLSTRAEDSRGGLKHNVEVTAKGLLGNLSNSNWPTNEYAFDRVHDCSPSPTQPNQYILSLHAESSGASDIQWTLSSGGKVTQSGWNGWMSSIP